MFAAIRRFFSKEAPWPEEEPTESPEGFPLKHRGFWYTGSWSSYRYDEQQAGREWRSDHVSWPVEGKIMFKYKWCAPQIPNGSDGRGLVDGLIPAMRLGDRVGLYEVTEQRRMPGSDRGMWDDGIEVDLRFVKSVSVDQVPSLRGLPADAKLDWEHVEIWAYVEPELGVLGSHYVSENSYTSYWLDVTVVIVGFSRPVADMPWGRAAVPEADAPVVRPPVDHVSEGHPMREPHEIDLRPVMLPIPEGKDPHQYAHEMGGVVAYGTYVPEGFKRGGNNRNWRSHT